MSRAGATGTARARVVASAASTRLGSRIRWRRWCQTRCSPPSGWRSSSASSPSGRPPSGSLPISRAERGAAPAGLVEQTVHAVVANRPRAGSESGASAMPSGSPRGTPSIERRETSTVLERSAPTISSAEA
ncbi:hypothetical protein GCM10027614_18010 [Micromonospora vulcania]